MTVDLPRTWRPLGPILAGVLFGGALLVVCAAAWLTFDAETQAKFTFLQKATLVGFGLMGFAALHAIGRSRVTATGEGLVVVNGYKHHALQWAQVVGVHLPPGAPWVTLDLADGSTLSAMGIQGSDGRRAREAVRELREAVEAAHPGLD